MINLRPGGRLIARATLCEVQTDAGSLRLKEPDDGGHHGDHHGDYGGDHHDEHDYYDDKIP